MKAKTITAKIRDAVQVCLMVEGDEVKRYKNIELPGEIKELKIRDFGFSIGADCKIDFNLHFEPDVLPKEFPAARAKVTRAEKAAAKAQMPEAIAEPASEAIQVADGTAQVTEVAQVIEISNAALEAAQPIKEPAAMPETSNTTAELADEKKAKPARKSRFCKTA